MLRSPAPRHILAWVVLLGLVGCVSVAVKPTTAATGPVLTVNAAAVQRPISPLIYGMNFADPSLMAELKLPINRWGGNHTTRYNWQNDITNKGSDWYFENIPEPNPDISQLPTNSAADRFVAQNRANNTATLLTVPIIGWVAKDSPRDHPYDCGFKVSRYGPQDNVDPYDPDCGNGFQGGARITGNNPTDTSIAVTPAFVQQWVTHLVSRFGNAAANGVRYYALDNEPGIWHETHRDVHPTAPGYDELWQRGRDYAIAIKTADPNAQILGPVQDGWTRYLYSSYVDYASAEAEKNAHGGKPFVQWYLEQMAKYQTDNGKRLLDYFDLHYYPQANGVALTTAGNTATQALRLRSTRSLWDPNYVDESWIATTDSATPVNGIGVMNAVQLLPRMRAWVNAHYPGTKLAISEYNWGGLEHINGALAQAEVLGIFGREGLDLATLWAPPKPNQPGAFAFRIYRNYDGNGSMFGDTSVQANSANPNDLSIFAATRTSDDSLTLVIINKTADSLTSNVNLSGFTPASSAQVYRYSSANLDQIVKQADQPISASGFTATFPASSITLVVVPPAPGSIVRQPFYLPFIQK